MRLAVITVLALSLVLCVCAAVIAGDYHVDAKLKCYQCHVMHATKSQAYSDDSHDEWHPGATTTYDKLLKYEDVNEICLECHNEADSKDVYGSTTDTTLNRVSGWFALSSDTAPYAAPLANPYGHDLHNGDQTPPGGSATYDLNCASCHEPHGNTNYRNLKDLAGDGSSAISYATTTNDATKDVFQAKIKKFDVTDVSYNLPDGASSHYEQFCVSCHTNVHSNSSTGGDWLKHPTVGYSKAYTTGTVSPLKTLGGQPIGGQTEPIVAGQASCVTCHKAHGSDHTFGLIYDNRTTAALEDSPATPTGSNSIRMTCKHCHDKGLTATE